MLIFFKWNCFEQIENMVVLKCCLWGTDNFNLLFKNVQLSLWYHRVYKADHHVVYVAHPSKWCHLSVRFGLELLDGVNTGWKHLFEVTPCKVWNACQLRKGSKTSDGSVMKQVITLMLFLTVWVMVLPRNHMPYSFCWWYSRVRNVTTIILYNLEFTVKIMSWQLQKIQHCTRQL
jgi:hypothetical protein